jgi:hypothetical protein
MDHFLAPTNIDVFLDLKCVLILFEVTSAINQIVMPNTT